MMIQNYKVIIIIGCQRTGTSLIGNIIGSHPACFLIDEPDGLYSWLYPCLEDNQEECEKLWPTLLQEANNKYRKKYSRLDKSGNIVDSVTHIILKAPNATYSVHALKKHFPDALYIFPVRDIRGIVSSMRRLAKISMLPKQINNIKENSFINNKHPDEVTKLVNPEVSDIRKMAIIARIKQSFLEEYVNEGVKVLRVPYEELVKDKNAWGHKITDHIGIQYDSLCNEHEKVMRGMGPGLTFRSRPVDKRSISVWQVRLEPAEEKEIWEETSDWMLKNGYKRSDESGKNKKSVNNVLIHSPIIATGRGGAGTRLLSSILVNSGVFMGNYLNNSMDSIEWVDLIYEAACKIVFDRYDHKDEKWTGPFLERATQVLGESDRGSIKHWGFKLPESMLILPALNEGFRDAKFIHLVRHPVDTCLRRTHMTSRRDNMVGKVVLPAAYDYVGRARNKIKQDEEHIHNAISYKFQVERAVKFGRNTLSPSKYLEIRYEDICNNLPAVIDSLSRFLNMPLDKSQIEINVDKLRIRTWSYPDSKADEIWDICGDTGTMLGYSFPD